MKAQNYQKLHAFFQFQNNNNAQHFIIILLLVMPFLANSQTNFRNGYYITWENDTIFGLIDYRGEIRNSGSCSFKENKNSDPIQFEPLNIKAYRFIDGKYYISKKIKIGNEEKPVFAEYLLNGIINLYFYRDINNYIYLIEDTNGKLTELTNKKEMDYVEGIGNVERNTKKYIGLLKATLADCAEIQNDIDKVLLDHNSLIEITKEYHDYLCDGEECIIYVKPAPKIKIRFAPVIGVGAASLHFNKGEFAKYSYGTVQYFFPGILLNFSFPKWNEKLTLNFETDLSKQNFYGNYKYISDYRTAYYSSNIDILSLQPSVTFKYSFLNEKVKPNISLGIYSNFFISVDQETSVKTIRQEGEVVYKIDDAPLASNIFGVLFQVGCDYQLKSRMVFSNLRVCQTALKEAGVSTFLNSLDFSLGMYLTKE